MKFSFITILLLLSNTLPLLGQNSDYGSQTYIHSVISEENKVYQLKVTLPANYNENKTYETLYYLDSWWLSELVLGTNALLNTTEQITDIVFVGITLEGNLLDWNIQRTFDFTPSKYNMPIEQRVGIGENAIPLDENTTGGAAIFMEFLETKIVTLIRDSYPNLSEKRGLLGHSFGGLFAFYIMQHKPRLFSDFIIISPALWWNEQELLNEKYFEHLKSSKKSTTLFLSYGEDESKWIVRSSIEMNDLITNLRLSLMDYEFVTYEKSNHNSVLPRAIYDGLLMLYKK